MLVTRRDEERRGKGRAVRKKRGLSSEKRQGDRKPLGMTNAYSLQSGASPETTSEAQITLLVDA